ncbi:MAG: hypothetical protein WCG85_01525 [Polyangia bacterium]
MITSKSASFGLLLMAVTLSACSVGQGVGEASGTLYVLSCSPKGDYCDSTGVCGTASAPAFYSLNPDFFAGEPINQLTQFPNGSPLSGSQPQMNRITIRLQHSGKQVENTDALFFDVVNSYEVARCVRGREIVVPGQPNVHDYDDRYCFRASATGPARVRISVEAGYIHSTLSPRMTCTRPVDATATDVLPVNGVVQIVDNGAWESWVEFVAFGSAAQNEQPDPTARSAISPDFSVQLNQRLYASAFSLTLQDEKVVTAQEDLLPVPNPDIGGSLTGNFDFDLKRGQGAQIFP